MLYEILNYGCCWHSRGHLFPVFTSCTLVLRTASHRSAAWHSPCHRWTLAQELLIKEHVRTAPSCHPCESQHLQPSRTLLNAAVLMKGAWRRTKQRGTQNKTIHQRCNCCMTHRRAVSQMRGKYSPFWYIESRCKLEQIVIKNGTRRIVQSYWIVCKWFPEAGPVICSEDTQGNEDIMISQCSTQRHDRITPTSWFL